MTEFDRQARNLDIPVLGADRHLRLIANEKGDHRYFGLITQIEEYLVAKQAQAKAEESMDKFPTDQFIDGVHQFIQEKKHTLSEEQRAWLREKLTTLLFMARVEERFFLLESLEQGYLAETAAARQKDATHIALLKSTESLMVSQRDKAWQSMARQLSEQANHTFNVELQYWDLESLAKGFKTNKAVPDSPNFVSFMEEVKAHYDEHLRQRNTAKHKAQRLIDQVRKKSSVDYQYLEQLAKERQQVEDFGHEVALASLDYRSQLFNRYKYRVRAEVDQAEQLYEQKDEHKLSRKEWVHSGGGYAQKFALIGPDQSTEGVFVGIDKSESGRSLETIQNFAIERVKQLLENSAKRPVVIVDIGGMYGRSALEIASHFGAEIQAGEVVVVVTNLEFTQEQIAQMITHHYKMGSSEKQRLLSLLSRNLVQYHRADASELASLVVDTSNGPQKLADLLIDLALESFSIVVHSSQLDEDIHHIASLMSDDGLFLSQDSGQAKGPLSHRALEGTAKVPSAIMNKGFEATDHPYLLFANPEAEGSRDRSATLSWSLSFNVSAAAKEFINQDFVEVREVPVVLVGASDSADLPEMVVTDTVAEAEWKVATPIIWAKRNALPLQIRDDQGKLVVEVPTHHSWVEQINDPAQFAPRLAKLFTALKNNFT